MKKECAECDLEEFLARKKETREICFNQRIRQICGKNAITYQSVKANVVFVIYKVVFAVTSHLMRKTFRHGKNHMTRFKCQLGPTRARRFRHSNVDVVLFNLLPSYSSFAVNFLVKLIVGWLNDLLRR